jgi:hypothetical protein
MNRIYSGAWKVAICIQAPKQDLRHVMTILSTSSDWGSLYDTYISADTEAFGSDWEPALAEVSALFALKYFSRVWISPSRFKRNM